MIEEHRIRNMVPPQMSQWSVGHLPHKEEVKYALVDYISKGNYIEVQELKDRSWPGEMTVFQASIVTATLQDIKDIRHCHNLLSKLDPEDIPEPLREVISKVYMNISKVVNGM